MRALGKTGRGVAALVVAWLALTTWASCVLPTRTAVCEAGQATGELFGNLACDLCASTSCCETSTACAGDPGCASLMACLGGCASDGEATCFDNCRKTIEYDAAVVDALLTCVSQRCETAACVVPERAAFCAAAGDVADVFGIIGCDLCVRKKACDAALNCADDPACHERIACMSNCTGNDLNPACFDQCRADGEFGVGDAQLFGAVARQCRSECRIGTSFECVNEYAWPTTNEKRVDVTHQALDRTAANAPFSGLVVTACASQSGSCESVGEPDPAHIDSQGVVVVNVPTSTGFDPVDDGSYSGFRGYLRFEREDPDPALWLPTILQHMRPEYRNRLADEVAPFAPGSLMQLLIELTEMNRMVEQDPARGVLLGGMVDCHGTVEFFAPDISVEVEGADDQTQYVYVDAAMTFLDFPATATTTAGQFVVVNVPAGSPQVTLRHVPSEQVVAQTTVNIVAGELTVLAAWPGTR